MLAKKTTLSLICCCLCFLLQAQGNHLLGNTIKPATSDNLDRLFTAWSTFEIDASQLNDFVQQQTDVFELQLSLGKEMNWEMELMPREVRTKNYQLHVGTKAGRQTAKKRNNITFKGQLTGDASSLVSLTLSNDFIYGFIEANDERYFIEPARYFEPELGNNLFLVYEEDALVAHNHGSCGATDLAHHGKKIEEQTHTGRMLDGDCYKVRIAVASDYSMVEKYGTIEEVENHVLGVLNSVQTNFESDFSDELSFEIATHFISDCDTCDPWTTSSNALQLLESFTAWGNGGNFGATYDVASLWTDRNLNGSTIGIAYVGAVCSSFRYNLLQNVNAGIDILRVLWSHELGHNFNATHDNSGSPFIMAPAVNNTNEWSTESEESISTFVAGLSNNASCLGDCSLTVTPPQAGFTATEIQGCAPLVVEFQGLTEGGQPESWSWTFPGGTPETSTDPNPVVIYNSPGDYDVTVEVSNEAGTDEIEMFNYIQIDNLPTANYNFNAVGREVSFTNTTVEGVTYNWDFGDGQTSTDPNPTHTYDEDGSYLVFLAATNECGTDGYSEFVTVVSAPTASFEAEVVTGCAPLEVQFSDLSSSNTENWSWTFEGGTPASSTDQNPLVVFESGGTFDVSLVVNNEAGEDQEMIADLIQVDNAPTADFTVSNMAGSLEINVENDSDNATTYEWDFGDGFSSDSEAPSHIYTEDGTYTISLTAFNDCGTTTTEQLITVVTLPTANFQADAVEGCAPFQVQFSDLSSDNTSQWEWTFEGGDPATSTASNPTVIFPNQGSFNVTLKVSNAAGTDELVQMDYIEVNPLPIADFAYSFQPESTTLNFINASQNALTYNWDFGDGVTSIAANPVHTYEADGIYTVTMQAFNECGVNEVVQMVQVFTSPTADFGVTEQVGCAPFEVRFNDFSSANVTNWNWTFEGGNPPTSNEQSPLVVYEQPGIYDVSLLVSNSEGQDLMIKEDFISVYNPVVANFAVSYTPGENTVVFTNNAQNGETYLWDFGDENTSTAFNPTHQYENNGVYEVSLTVTNGCSSATLTQTVTIVTMPIAGFESTTTLGCAPLSVEFTDQSSNIITDWDWIFEGGFPASSEEQNPVITFFDPGIFDVTLTVGNSAGENTLVMENHIAVLEAPNAAFEVVYDLGENQVIFENNSSSADAYSWDFGDGNMSTAEQPTHTYAEDGLYTVTLTAEGDCGIITTSQIVAVITAPVASFTADTTLGCPGDIIEFSDFSTGNANFWNWTFEGGTPATSSEQNPVVTYETPGVYAVSLEVGNEGGSNSIEIQDYIQIDPGPDAGFTGMINGTTVSFNNNSINSNSYFWEFGDGNFSLEENPTHTYAAEGTYEVSLNAKGDCGNETIIQTIVIEEAVNAPVADFEVSIQAGCAPFTVDFTDQSGFEPVFWLWTFEGGTPATSTAQNPSVVYNQPGNYGVTLEVVNSAGSDMIVQEQIISVDAYPITAFSYSIDGNTLFLANSSQYADSFLWDFGDGNTSTIINPIHTYEDQGTYTVELTAFNDCGAISFTKTLSIVAPPIAGFSVEGAVGCAPFTTNFVNESSNNVESWFWTFEGGTPTTSTEENPIVTFDEPGSYTVSLAVSNAAGESTVSQQDYITVYAEPIAYFSLAIDGGRVKFTSNAQFADNYFWDFGNGSTSAEANPLVEYLYDGEYEVMFVVSNACGSDTVTTILEIMAPPIPNFVGSPLIGCHPLEVQLTDLSENNVQSWTWNLPGGSPNVSEETNPSVLYTIPGTYDVELRTANEIGQSERVKEDYITILAAPEIDFAVQVNGLSIQVENTSLYGGTYLWDFGDGTTSTDTLPTHTYLEDGTYEVTLIASNECGQDTLSQSVLVSSTIPSVAFDLESDGDCIPKTVSFINLTLNADSFEWTFPGGIPATSTEAEPTVVYETPGYYDVTLVATNANGSSAFTQVGIVEVLDNPQAIFEFTLDALVISFINSSAWSTEFYWDFGDGTTSSIGSPIHAYNSPGSYEVMLIATNSCASDTTFQTVVIDGQAPTPDFTSATFGCVPYTVNYIDQSTEDPQSWFWEFQGGNPASSLDQNPMVTYTNTGVYPVSLTVTNAYGSSTQTWENYIAIQDAPIASFEVTVEQSMIELNNTSIGEDLEFSWDFGDGSGSDLASPIHVYENPGMYTITLTASNDCGTTSMNQEISIIISSVAEGSNNLELAVFPNPNTGLFNLTINGVISDDVWINLLSASGQQLLNTQAIAHSGKISKVFDLKYLANGVYFLQINTDEQSFYKKVIIKR